MCYSQTLTGERQTGSNTTSPKSEARCTECGAFLIGNGMNDMTMDQREQPPFREKRKGEYLPGYEAVLIRGELKQKMRDWRNERGMRDTHIERCLMSAVMELALDPANEERLMSLLGQAILKDFQMMSANPEGHHVESRGAPR